MAKKICLFTAHSPLSGGGSVILHSLTQNLPEYSFYWMYLANEPVTGYESGFLGRGLMGGNIIKDFFQTRKLLNSSLTNSVNKIVEKLLKVDCDQYWIVSHNEGLRVGFELAKNQTDIPVHLTIHDDWAGALSARSFRYRFLSKTSRKLTVKTLQKVTDFDVISKGMQSYYREISGRIGNVCHRYLPADTINQYNTRKNYDDKVDIGHIGSIYDTNDFLKFARLVKYFAAIKKTACIIHLWGCHLKDENLPSDIEGIIKLHKNSAEKDIITILSSFSFVYAMYPMNPKMKIFSQTSLPTKLSTYVQCGVPIYAQAPSNSTLSYFINETATGVVWNDDNIQNGLTLLEKIISLEIDCNSFVNARNAFFGESNLTVMRSYFQ